MDLRRKINYQKYEVDSNRLIVPILFMAVTIILELVNFLYIGFKNDFGQQLTFPVVWLLNIGAMFIIAALIYAVKTKWAMATVFFVFIGLQTTINIINVQIYSIFGDLFTFGYFELRNEAVAAFEWSFIDFGAIFIYLGILAAIIASIVLLYKYNKRKIQLTRLSAYIFSAILVLLIEFTGLSMMDYQIRYLENNNGSNVEGNQSFLWQSFALKSESYKQFGYYGFYIKNVYDSVLLGLKTPHQEIKELEQYIADGETTESDLDGRLSGDNLILVLCESLDTFAIDPINTPFLYNLMHGNSSSFTSFYGNNKTNVSEHISLTGNMAKKFTVNTLMNQFNGYDYEYTLPKLFKQSNSNAKVNYFHSYIGSFYNRETTYGVNEDGSGIGFDNIYSLEDYSGEKTDVFGEWARDEQFINDMSDLFIPNEGQFFSCYATISTHGPYTKYKANFEDLYQQYDDNYLDYKTYLESIGMGHILDDSSIKNELRGYKVGAIDLNNAIKRIFELLEEKGKLEDTTVVLYGDHNSYYEDLCYRIKGVKEKSSEIEGYNIPLIIYNSDLPKGQFDVFCNTYDIFPTICELHGLNYNKNLVHGHNIYSSDIENSFFASHLSDQMFNRDFYSTNISNVEWIGENCTEDDLKKFKQLAELFYQKQAKIELIYLYNIAK